jgi:hypothetical protein
MDPHQPPRRQRPLLLRRNGGFLEARRVVDDGEWSVQDSNGDGTARYYARLLDVSRQDDWTGWCEFFLRALIAQAEENQTKAQEILSLYRERKDWVVEVTRHVENNYCVSRVSRCVDIVKRKEQSCANIEDAAYGQAESIRYLPPRPPRGTIYVCGW